jgi:hypothetical protein
VVVGKYVQMSVESEKWMRSAVKELMCLRKTVPHNVLQ